MRRAILICWVVSASMVRTIDGDSFVGQMDIWPGLIATAHIRVLGVDTPEMKAPTMEAAQKARAYAQEWLNRDDFLVAIGCGNEKAQDSFGRYLGQVTRGGRNLAEDVISAGHG